MKSQRKKRKLFLGVSPIGGPVLKSRRVARNITSKFHSIQNQIHLLERNVPESVEDDMERKAKICSLRKDIEEIGGRDRYQQASIISTQHFKTSRFFIYIVSSMT